MDFIRFVVTVKEIDMNILGENLCKIMKELGGDFVIDSVSEKKCRIKANKCPWGKEGKKNPVLTMLCRCIFTRISIRVFDKVIVKVDKAPLDKEECCIITINRN